MTSTIPALEIRRRLDKNLWGIPRPFGPDGWMFEHRLLHGRIIVTNGPTPENEFDFWWHASISFRENVPTYWHLQNMHRAIWPNGYAYQCFVPPSEHVNIAEHALHLFGRPDGRRVLPNFGANGTI